MSKSAQAVKTFQRNFNCAQSVFSVFSEDYGMDKNLSLKIATPFGGGIAMNQKVCGAVTGALMVLGLKNGQSSDGSEEDKKNTLFLSNKFISDFIERNGSIDCLDLLGVDINTEEGKKEIEEGNLMQEVCEKCVKDAAEIVEKYLQAG